MNEVTTSGIILAGGRSRRMGVDKAFIRLEGKTLIEIVIHALRSVCDEILIVADDQERFVALDAILLRDTQQNTGPLAGLHAGLTNMQSELGIVVAVDMPFLNAALLRAMLAVAEGWDAVVPAPSSDEHKRVDTRMRAKDLNIHPLHAVYRRTCLPAITDAIESGERRLNAFFADINVRYLSRSEMHAVDPEMRSLININTPQELEQALKSMK